MCPTEYFKELLTDASNGKAKYGAISTQEDMVDNFKMHCIPNGMENKDIEHYDDFLNERRKLIAWKIKEFYNIL